MASAVSGASAPSKVEVKPHLSWSAISDYLRCGKAFQLSRVLGLPEQPGMSRAGGRAVHVATEAYDRWLLTQ